MTIDERDLCVKAHEAMGWSLKPCYFGPKGGPKRWAKPNSQEGVYQNLRSIESGEFITEAIEFCRDSGIVIVAAPRYFDTFNHKENFYYEVRDNPQYDLGLCLAQTLVKWKDRQVNA